MGSAHAVTRRLDVPTGQPARAVVKGTQRPVGLLDPVGGATTSVGAGRKSLPPNLASHQAARHRPSGRRRRRVGMRVRTAGSLREGSAESGRRLRSAATSGDDGCDAPERGKPRRATGTGRRQRQTVTTDASTEQRLEVERALVETRNAARNGKRATACRDAGAAVRVGKALKGRASVGKPRSAMKRWSTAAETR